MEDLDETEVTPAAPPFDPDEPMISLSAITGIWAEKTMQHHVHIGAHQFTALLDSGSTHNFISTEAARRADLQLQDSHGAHVVVANGDQVTCHSRPRRQAQDQ